MLRPFGFLLKKIIMITWMFFLYMYQVDRQKFTLFL